MTSAWATRRRAAAAERAGHGGGYSAAHRARRSHLQQHHERKHEGQSGKRIGAEAADEMRIGDRHRGLEEGEHQSGRGEPRDRRQNRRLEEALRAAAAHAAAAADLNLGASLIGRWIRAAAKASITSAYHIHS